MPQVANKEENKKVYSEFVFKLFFDADTRERDVFILYIIQGEVSAELMQMFQAAIKFIDVLNYFEPLTPDILEKCNFPQYSRKICEDEANRLSKKIEKPCPHSA